MSLHACKQAMQKGCCTKHLFGEEVQELRANLLDWYGANRRQLPWRERAQNEVDPNKRAYAVWVSEIMLQQTQVATVTDYYIRWMEKWETVEKLAEATLEEVNSMWSGLGYYSRGQRLWEGAKKVVSKLNGVIPNTHNHLAKLLPGVGQYTAGAISSIAFGEVTGVVDGNVMRVFSRHRLIGADITQQSAIKHFWELANVAVDPQQPGDFNQALMELGATVCTPRTPKCESCPIRASCGAYIKQECKQAKILLSKDVKVEDQVLSDVEDCPLCLSSWKHELGVMNFPCKTKKKPPLVQHFVTALLDCDNKLLLRQRPNKGLLAGLWEFPSVELATSEGCEQEQLEQLLTALFPSRERIIDSSFLGKVVHQFSHTHHHYQCWLVRLSGHPDTLPLSGDNGRCTQWVRREQVTQSAIPTAVKKMLKLLNEVPLRKRSCGHFEQSKTISTKKQKTIESYFS